MNPQGATGFKDKIQVPALTRRASTIFYDAFDTPRSRMALAWGWRTMGPLA